MKFFFILLFVFLFNGNSMSNEFKISEIKVIGNKTISKETILSTSEFSEKKINYNSENLNLAQKKLYQTNFFSKVDFEVKNNTLIIIVVENPIIDFLFIEGLDDNNELKKNIEKLIFLKSNLIFSEAAINNDIISIKNYLTNLGYFNSQINYVVKKNQFDRVNIFFDIKLNNQFSIKNIFFIGDVKFSSSKLMDVITSRHSSWFSFFNSNSIPSSARLTHDTSLLKNFYLTEGYYDVQITNSSIDLVDDRYANLIFAISSGNKFIVDEYLIDNNLSFLKSNQITRVNNILKKYLKTTYNYKKVIELRDEIKNYLLESNIVPEIQYSFIKKNDNLLVLKIRIDQNNVKKIVKEIIVVGNEITEEKVIRNNLLFSEGDIFSEIDITKSKDLLQSLKIFKSVSINSTFKDPADVKIEIKVEEQPTGEISTGLGFGTEGASLSFNLRENNFLGKGIYTNIGVNIGTQQILGSITFNNPDFADSGINLKNSIFVTKYNYNNSGYQNKVIGDQISTINEVFKDIFFENGFGVSYDQIQASDNATPLIASQVGNYLTTKYFYDVTSDKTNRKFKPTAGYTISFGQDFGLPPSDIPFIANNLYGSFHNSLSEDFIGTIRYRIKAVNSLSGDPIKLSDRTNVSISELRGFENRGIGPKVNGDFIGGNYSFSSSISSTFPNGIPDSWNATTNIFLDLANVWGSDISGVESSNKIRSSIGAAFTWISPIGPVSLSYAEPISKKNTDAIQKFSFNIGSAF